jgi:NAD(P)H-dependent flavin oxidoreductase YrpB (nitropropane dioxygenase family)
LLERSGSVAGVPVAVNTGTRFLATPESPIHQGWKQAILAADAVDAVKVELFEQVLPG